MKRVFISYARTPVEQDLARWITARLRAAPGIEHVFLDEESLSPGDHLRGRIVQAIHASHAVVLLISRSWLERDHTTQELEDVTAADATGEMIRRVAVFRQPRSTFPILPAALSRFAQPIELIDSITDPHAALWEIYCGVMSLQPGPRAEWYDRGAALGSHRGNPPEAVFIDPVGDRPSLECGRDHEWADVAGDSVGRHRLIVIAGSRGEDHGHFVRRIERFLGHTPARSIVHIDWGTGAGGETRPQHKDDYLECLRRALARNRHDAGVADALRSALAHQNVIAIHPRIDSLFDDDQLISYYTEWLPDVLDTVKPRMRLKCIQPVAWSASGRIARALQRMLRARTAVLSPLAWLCGSEERLARRLLRDLQNGGTARVHDLRPLLPIELSSVSRQEVAAFCDRKVIDGVDREEILRRVASIETSEKVFAAIDRYLVARRRRREGAMNAHA